ncbi:BspA family leucine-rich repeat surface protein [Enterococcus faecalis]|uniref:BspA family leucine-rich repeat surface protein n=1 Tax=Enterococcus faecalis TaxID=1351 RepID=UPI0025B0C5CA|nr:BspA family leucine-rich repeat surface protein [Enterococcus faecalis]MDN3115003.1 BspA family leucine-rich repeat surface protein [Enterococcus faecalis]
MRKTLSVITAISLFSTMLLPITVMAEEAKSEELNKKEITVLPENKIDMETSDENLKNNEQIPSGEINITDNSDGISKTEVTEQEQEENNIIKTSPEKTEISTLEASTYANSNGWEYTDKGTYCVITAYSGTEKDWVVPNEINGKPTKITSDTFHNSGKNPESVTIQAGRFGKVGVEGSSLRGLFTQIRSLKSVDLSGLDTSNVTDMGYMFQAASALTSVNLNGLNTSNVRQMDYMFDTYASGLTTLDLSSFDTSNVVTMGNMFMSATGLQTVNLSSFNTSRVTQMSYMFWNCSSLTNLDISNFDTSNVEEMRYMFAGCSKLTSLNLSNFNTSKVRMMNMMFENCSSLTSVDLSSFDTSNVQSMQRMFKNSPGLTKLDLRNFTSSSLTNTSEMFYMATTTPLTVIVTDATFLNYNYIADNRTIGQLLLNANGGTFNDGSVEKNYFTSCAIRPEETSLDKLEEFKQNNLPTKTGFLFNGYTTTTDTSQATSVLDLIGTVYDAQWKTRTVSLEVPTTISFGTHKLSKGTNYYSVDTVEGTSLSITDDRGIGSKWQLTAKLQTPFTNNGKILSNSLVYKTSTGEETITENAAQVIATHTTGTDSEKTVVSDNWTNTQGLMLKLEEGKAYAGEYSGTIEWTLNDTP